MIVYNTTQDDYSQRCKEKIKRQFEITGTSVDDEDVEKMVEEGNDNPTIFTGGVRICFILFITFYVYLQQALLILGT